MLESILFYKLYVLPCLILGAIFLCIYTPMKNSKISFFINRNKLNIVIICLLLSVVYFFRCMEEIKIIIENSVSAYWITILTGGGLLYAIALFLIYAFEVLAGKVYNILSPSDDFIKIENKSLFKNNGLLNKLIPEPVATFANSQDIIIRFFDRKTEKKLLIPYFILLILFCFFSILLVLLFLSDVRVHRNFFGAVLTLLIKIFTTDDFASIFEHDMNVVYLFGGMNLAGLYCYLFYLFEIMLLKQNYYRRHVAWKVSGMVFAVLSAIICCFPISGILKFLICFCFLPIILLSIYYTNINRIKAKITKDYNL